MTDVLAALPFNAHALIVALCLIGAVLFSPRVPRMGGYVEMIIIPGHSEIVFS